MVKSAGGQIVEEKQANLMILDEDKDEKVVR